MNDIKIQIDIYATRAYDALIAAGYCDEDIDNAASGFLSGTRIQPTAKRNRPTPHWLWAESLGYARDALRHLSDGEPNAAQANLDQAREQSGHALELQHEMDRRHNAGIARTGRVKPITAMIRAMVASMDDPRPEALLAEFGADASDRGNALLGLRENGVTEIVATGADRDGFDYLDRGTGKTGHMSIGRLRNAVSEAHQTPCR